MGPLRVLLTSCDYFSSQPSCFTLYFPCGDTFKIAKAQKWKLSSRILWERHESEACARFWLLSLNQILVKKVFASEESLWEHLKWEWAALIRQVTAQLPLCETRRHSLNAKRFFLTHVAFQGEGLQLVYVLTSQRNMFPAHVNWQRTSFQAIHGMEEVLANYTLSWTEVV